MGTTVRVKAAGGDATAASRLAQSPPSFIEGIVARVAEDLGVAAEDVRRHAIDIHRRFATARVHTYVPLLVEKQLRDALRRLGARAVDVTDDGGRLTVRRS